MNNINKSVVKKIIDIILIIAIASIAILIIVSAGYTYLCEDDFSFEAGVLDLLKQYDSAFKGAIYSTCALGMAQQGTYVFNFLIYFIHAYTRWGLPGFHMVMIFIAVFFIGSIWYCVESILEDRTYSLFVMLLCMVSFFTMSGTIHNQELVLWYTGVLNYTLEMSFSLLGLGFFVKAIRTEKTKYIVLASVFSFLGSWGTLEVAAPNCAWKLIIIVLCYKKILDKKMLSSPFLCAFLAACINAFSPGTFKRSEMEKGVVGITEAESGFGTVLHNLISCYSKETKQILGSPIFLLVLIAILGTMLAFPVVLGNISISWQKLCLCIVMALITQILTMFPVVWGYHSAELRTSRTQAMYEIVAKLMYIFIVVCIALWIRNCEYVAKYGVIGLGVLFAILLVVRFGGIRTELSEGYAGLVAQDMYDGSLYNNYAVRSYVLETMEMAEDGSDLLI